MNIRLEAPKLRSASPADSEFCFQLHKAAMGGYITTIWGWDEQVQRASMLARSTRAAGRSLPLAG